MDDRNKELTPPPEHAAAPPPEFTLPPELLPPDTALPGEKAAATGAPSRTARRSCTGTNRSLSPFRSPSMGERSRQMHKMIATTVSDNAVPNAAPVTPRSAPAA